MEKATFGAGCFWGAEAAFRQTKGVVSTAVGYMGGTLKNPTYKDVCTDRTGHAEVVQVEYDPAVVSYIELLKVVWLAHNPTTMNSENSTISKGRIAPCRASCARDQTISTTPQSHAQPSKNASRF